MKLSLRKVFRKLVDRDVKGLEAISSVGREEANMTAVCLQKTVHCTGNLALEIIHDNQGRYVVSCGLMNTVDVGDDDPLYVLDHGDFV